MSAPTTPAKTVLTPRPGNLKFLKASEAAGKQGLCMILYGIPGSGKTVLAASSQDSEYGKDVLLIDFDGGVKSIEDRDDILVYRPDKFSDLLKIAEGIRSGEYPFKTVVIDTLSEAQARDMKEITGGSSTPEIRHWQMSSNNLANTMRAFRDLAYGPRAINVIFTAHVKETTDEKGVVTAIRPMMTPSAMNIAIGAVDVLGYLTYIGGKRVLSFKGTSITWAKIRQGRTSEVTKLPDRIEEPGMPFILNKLYQTRGGGTA